MLSGKRTLLVIVTGVMLAVLAGMLLLRKMPRLERAAWILSGGGVGNLIDRIRTGVVVDYLNCLFINFPVFNFADVCICVGVGLLVLSLLLDMRREQKSKQQRGVRPQMEQRELTLAPESVGLRLDRWLAEQCPDLSRSQLQNLDRSGQCDLQRQPLEQKG